MKSLVYTPSGDRLLIADDETGDCFVFVLNPPGDPSSAVYFKTIKITKTETDELVALQRKRLSKSRRAVKIFNWAWCALLLAVIAVVWL